MKKHNNIQDRIKLLMEYDTSKTYSENKELINEGLPTWLKTKGKDFLKFLKNRYFRIKMTQAQWKETFTQLWAQKYSKPSLVVNELNKAKLTDLSSNIKENLADIVIVKNKILEIIKLKDAQNVSSESMINYEKQLQNSFDNLVDLEKDLFKAHFDGLTLLGQINQYGIQISNTRFLRDIMNAENKINRQALNGLEFNKFIKNIENVYKEFNQELTSQATLTQQKWSYLLALLTATHWISDLQILGWLFKNFINMFDVNFKWDYFGIDLDIRTDSRLKFIIPTYCSTRTSCNSSSKICNYIKLIGENLGQNQVTLLYTLIYGVLTKKPNLSNTKSEDFCYLLRKYKATILNFDKNEKELRQSILISIDTYRTTNSELLKLFSDVWVKDNKININFNVIENFDKQIESFLITRTTQIESKIVNNNFKQKINEQQPKPNQEKQPKPNQEKQPIQSSAFGAAAAGTLLQKLYSLIPWSFLKEIKNKAGGKIWGWGGIIWFILANVNITEKLLEVLVDLLTETKTKAFLNLFNNACGGKQKRRRSNNSLDIYVSLFNDRVYFEELFPSLENKNINMALWVIFGDYVNNTKLFNMGDLCYINAKTNGKFAEDFQKFYNNLPNLTIEQLKSKSVQNVNAVDKIWNKTGETYKNAGLGGVFNKILNIYKTDKDGRFTEVEVLNDLAGFKKIDINLMVKYYLNNKVNQPNTNNTNIPEI